MHILRRFRRSVNQLIRRDLLGVFSEALSTREEGFFSEWKLGNTSNEKPRDPAFGGVFFCLSINELKQLVPIHLGIGQHA